MRPFNREGWLRRAYAILRRELVPQAPAVVAISWSFPSTRASAHGRRRIGECWGGQGVRGRIEGGHALLVSPTIEDAVGILATILHEMIHATVGVAEGHRRAFSRLAARVGFARPWTQSTVTPELEARLRRILDRLPRWPEGHLAPVPKQRGRHLKVICSCRPPRILRAARRTLAEGPIVCGLCSTAFSSAGRTRRVHGQIRKAGAV